MLPVTFEGLKTKDREAKMKVGDLVSWLFGTTEDWGEEEVVICSKSVDWDIVSIYLSGKGKKKKLYIDIEPKKKGRKKDVSRS